MADEPRCRVSIAANGMPTVCVATAAGRERWLHSQRDPAAEGERLAATVPADAPAVLVAGLGLGYHAAALRRRLPRAELFIIEPVRELIALAGRHGVFTADPATTFLSGAEAELVAALARLAPRLEQRAAVLIHVPSLELLRATHPRVAPLLDVIRMQRNTVARQDGVVPENLAGNRALAETDPDYPVLAPRLANRMPVLVAAGPTLDLVRPLLRQHRDRLAIAAVDTALAALAADGMEPDLVVAVDPYPANVRHFLAMGETCVLVYSPAVDPAIPRLFPAGRRAVVLPRAHRDEPALRDWWGDRPVINGGSTVAVAALELLQRLGRPGPLLIAGCDFGFPFGSVYARGTRFHRQASAAAGRFATVENANRRAVQAQPLVPAVNAAGAAVATHTAYFSFRTECEACLARDARFRYIQVEGHGLAMRGVEHMTMRQAQELLA
ncbi:MAG TPA: DUF115 domain-containing protein [bacterium]|nr:DUF115 domain-containing protein [bacterium]